MINDNEYKEPEVQAEISQGGSFLKNENGSCVIETIVPESGEIEIKGQLMSTLKNGMNRYYPWSYTIKVLKPK